MSRFCTSGAALVAIWGSENVRITRCSHNKVTGASFLFLFSFPFFGVFVVGPKALRLKGREANSHCEGLEFEQVSMDVQSKLSSRHRL